MYLFMGNTEHYIYIYIYIVIWSVKAKKVFVIELTVLYEESFN